MGAQEPAKLHKDSVVQLGLSSQLLANPVELTQVQWALEMQPEKSIKWDYRVPTSAVYRNPDFSESCMNLALQYFSSLN